MAIIASIFGLSCIRIAADDYVVSKDPIRVMVAVVHPDGSPFTDVAISYQFGIGIISSLDAKSVLVSDAGFVSFSIGPQHHGKTLLCSVGMPDVPYHRIDETRKKYLESVSKWSFNSFYEIKLPLNKQAAGMRIIPKPAITITARTLVNGVPERWVSSACVQRDGERNQTLGIRDMDSCDSIQSYNRVNQGAVYDIVASFASPRNGEKPNQVESRIIPIAEVDTSQDIEMIKVNIELPSREASFARIRTKEEKEPNWVIKSSLWAEDGALVVHGATVLGKHPYRKTVDNTVRPLQVPAGTYYTGFQGADYDWYTVQIMRLLQAGKGELLLEAGAHRVTLVNGGYLEFERTTEEIVHTRTTIEAMIDERFPDGVPDPE